MVNQKNLLPFSYMKNLFLEEHYAGPYTPLYLVEKIDQKMFLPFQTDIPDFDNWNLKNFFYHFQLFVIVFS